MIHKEYKRYFLLLLFFSTLIRSAIAFSTELGNDEVYYRLFASNLQWNYFDHPPMVAWLIRLTTGNLFLDTDFFIRLGAVLCGSATLIMIYKCGKILKDERAAFWASAIYAATLYGTVISGTFILPDSPQMLFWSISLFFLIKISDQSVEKFRLNSYLILFGISAGLGMLSKVHSVFLWLGLGMFILTKRRDIFNYFGLYLGLLLSFIIFLPVILWNFDNHFITYRFHSNRVSHLGSGINLESFLSFNFGQVFYTSIILFPIFIKSIISFIKKNKSNGQHSLLIILWVSLPLIIVSTFLSIFNTILPHWTGPSFSGLSLITSIYLIEKFPLEIKFPKIIGFALGLTLFICISGLIVINFFPGTIGNKDDFKKGDGDFTLDMYGWSKAKDQVSLVINDDIRNKTMSKDALIIENKWFPAAHIEHYIANPLNKTVLVFGPIGDIHQYYFLNNERNTLKKGDNAYSIVPSNYSFDAIKSFENLFSSYDTAAVIPILRGNKISKKIYLLRLKNYKK